MTVAEVLRILGPPQFVRWEKDLPFFVYPQKRDTVWFVDGKVAFVYGQTLSESAAPVARAGEPAAPLLERFGTPEELNVFSCWWPQSGVVVSAWRTVSPDDKLEAIGLRSLQIPVKWVTSRPVISTAERPTRWSSDEPWMDDYAESWRMNGIPLGVQRADVRKAAGKPARSDARTDVYATGLIVHYSRSGWVCALDGGQSLTHLAHLGHHVLTQGPFKIGEPLQFRALTDRSAPPEIKSDGVTVLTPQVRVTLEKGRVKRFQLSGDPALFDALDAAAKP